MKIKSYALNYSKKKRKKNKNKDGQLELLLTMLSINGMIYDCPEPDAEKGTRS
jgi:hypothetical protein